MKNKILNPIVCREEVDESDDNRVQMKPSEDKLFEQIDSLEERNLKIDNELDTLRNELATLRREMQTIADENALLKKQFEDSQAVWHHEASDLHSMVYDLADSFHLENLHGTEASRQIRYRQSIRRLRDAVRRNLPRESKILVVSRGDDDLLKQYGRRASHFPQCAEGIYSGCYPACGMAAVAQLEVLRAQGAEYFLFPESALWWLEDPKYVDFRRHLETRYRTVLRDPHVGAIFSLKERSEWFQLSQSLNVCRSRLGREVSILNWNVPFDFESNFEDATVFRPNSSVSKNLPYLDQSVDFVALVSEDEAQLIEARRVASEAVLRCGSEVSEECINIEWKSRVSERNVSVSIVIPLHNHASTTVACFSSLVETLPLDFQGEIIFVDDASTDETPLILERWTREDSRVRSIYNDSNHGFLRSSQIGANAARGDILIFLNNDTILLPNWLPPILRVFREHPNAGAVGGKLLFPDGTLQEAGGMVFNDGSAANFGRGSHDLEHFTFNMLREVDYCSGALLATPRLLFESIGGFDPLYTPAYYEDTDYCMTVKQLGYSVYFQPESVVIHLEGVSSGTDVTHGVKQYQKLNQVKFVEKWSEALATKPSRPNDEFDRASWDALALGHSIGRKELV